MRMWNSEHVLRTLVRGDSYTENDFTVKLLLLLQLYKTIHHCQLFKEKKDLLPIHACLNLTANQQFSVPQIEYTLGGTSKMGSHVYFLLIVAMVLLL